MLYMMVRIFLIRRAHLHDRIITLRGDACAHKTSLPPPLFIEVPVQEQRSLVWVAFTSAAVLCPENQYWVQALE